MNNGQLAMENALLHNIRLEDYIFTFSDFHIFTLSHCHILRDGPFSINADYVRESIAHEMDFFSIWSG